MIVINDKLERPVPIKELAIAETFQDRRRSNPNEEGYYMVIDKYS